MSRGGDGGECAKRCGTGNSHFNIGLFLLLFMVTVFCKVTVNIEVGNTESLLGLILRLRLGLWSYYLHLSNLVPCFMRVSVESQFLS